jgi:hypothetical protein
MRVCSGLLWLGREWYKTMAFKLEGVFVATLTEVKQLQAPSSHGLMIPTVGLGDTLQPSDLPALILVHSRDLAPFVVLFPVEQDYRKGLNCKKLHPQCGAVR